MKAEKDPMGRAIADYHATGKAAKLRVFSPMFDEDEIPVKTLFRSFDEMPAIEQTALREATGRITLWYTEADFSPAVMANLIARCRTDTGLRIEARAFPDEQTLGLAFEEGRPELLFCNHFRAARLSENLSPLPEERAFRIRSSLRIRIWRRRS